MEFMVRLYEKQLEGGRVFVHGRPAHAKSWALPCIRRVMRETGVDVVEACQCMYVLKTWCRIRAPLVLAKKPTNFMTSSRSIGGELKKRCNGAHDHQPLVDGRARDAARYPPALCRAICRGVVKEKMQRQLGIRAVMEVVHGVHRRTIETEEYHETPDSDMRRAMMSEFGKEELPAETHSDPSGCSIAPLGANGGSRMEEIRRLIHCKNWVGDITSSLAWDDLNGMKLEAGRVIEARAKEVTYLREKRVYDKVHRQYAMGKKW